MTGVDGPSWSKGGRLRAVIDCEGKLKNTVKKEGKCFSGGLDGFDWFV